VFFGLRGRSKEGCVPIRNWFQKFIWQCARLAASLNQAFERAKIALDISAILNEIFYGPEPNVSNISGVGGQFHFHLNFAALPGWDNYRWRTMPMSKCITEIE
jgi:hypothetical protein